MFAVKTNRYGLRIVTDETRIRRALEEFAIEMVRSGHEVELTDLNFLSGMWVFTGTEPVIKDRIINRLFSCLKEGGYVNERI